MNHRKFRLVSCVTLATFVPFALIAGIPVEARAATNPILSIQVTDPQSGASVTLHGAEGEGGNLVLTTPESPGFQLLLSESDLQAVTVEKIEEGKYVLAHGEERSSLQVTMGGASGPEEGQITYTGEAVDKESGKRVEFTAVTRDLGGEGFPQARDQVRPRALPAVAVIVIVVVSVGAVLCLGVIGIEAATSDCAKNCTSSCGEGAVATCKTKIIAGVSWGGSAGVKVGCGADCESSCTPPSARAPTSAPIGALASLQPASACGAR